MHGSFPGNLAGPVTLARNEDDIARLGECDCPGYRFRPVFDPFIPLPGKARGSQTRFDAATRSRSIWEVFVLPFVPVTPISRSLRLG